MTRIPPFISLPVVLFLLELLGTRSAASAGATTTTGGVATGRIAWNLGQQYRSRRGGGGSGKTPLVWGTSSGALCNHGQEVEPTTTVMPTSLVGRVGANNKRSAARGGASAAAVAVKTMTASQFEAYNLLSGGVAGTVASCLTNPLEVIKTQLQSSAVGLGGLSSHPLQVAERIFRQDGLSGFFRGLPPTLIGIIPSRSAYFYAYQRVKHALGNNRYLHLPEGSPPNALVAGFLAGIAGNTLTNPIWMIRTRMQLQADQAAGQRVYSGYADVVTTIFREEGLGGFYKGIMASYWGCTEGAAQFILYEQFKAKLLRRENANRAAHGLPPTRDLSRGQYFWSAALAKMLASIATYPHEVARTRLREQARSGIFKYHGMWQTLGLIAQEEGSHALYAGLGVHLMKVVPNSAFMFLTYEIVRKWLSEYTIVAEPTTTTSTVARR